MIDNIKLNIENNLQFENHLTENQVIDLRTTVCTYTGEESDYPKKGKLLNLTVNLTTKNATIQGSLHKYQNIILENGNQNYNNFSFNQINKLIPQITSVLRIEDKATVSILEFGFNIEVSSDPQEIVDYNILMFDCKGHNKDLKYGGKGDYKEFQKSDFRIKTYNKSKQSQLKTFILRLEIKILATRLLKSLNIYKFENLLNTHVMQNLFNRLICEVEKLTIIDKFYLLDIGIEDREKLIAFTNPNYWKMAQVEKSWKVRKRLKRDFDALILKHRLNSTKLEIITKLKSKFLELMSS